MKLSRGICSSHVRRLNRLSGTVFCAGFILLACAEFESPQAPTVNIQSPGSPVAVVAGPAYQAIGQEACADAGNSRSQVSGPPRFEWRPFAANPEEVRLSSVPAPCFRAATPGKYRFTLIYTDGEGRRDSALWEAILIKPRIFIGTPRHMAGIPDSLVSRMEFHGTISAGIAAADSGDTVFLAPGVYREHVQNLKSGVFLLGAGFENTVLDGNSPSCDSCTGDFGAALRLHGVNRIRIEGMTIRGALPPRDTRDHRDAGSLSIDSCESVEVRRCRFGPSIADGIRIFQSGQVTIRESQVRFNGSNGIRGTRSEFSVEKCDLHGNGNGNPAFGGIALDGDGEEAPRNVRISGNTFKDNRYANIMIRSDFLVGIRNNVFLGYGCGVYYDEDAGGNLVLEDNVFGENFLPSSGDSLYILIDKPLQGDLEADFTIGERKRRFVGTPKPEHSGMVFRFAAESNGKDSIKVVVKTSGSIRNIQKYLPGARPPETAGRQDYSLHVIK